MKTLGMIGGTSWHSTIEYYRYINEIVTEKTENPLINPPLLIHSLNIELMRRGDWDEINHAFVQFALKLQNAGAEALILCANTPHKVVPFVEPHLNIPFIHIADATADAAKKMNITKLGLLGTQPTMEDGFIRDRLVNNHQIDTVVPDDKGRAEIHRTIVEELTLADFKEETRQYYLEQMQDLKERGAQGIILGCTEIPLLIKPEDFDLPLFNTTYLHADMAVDFILS